jgi:SAM-dependent methyltransferase
MLTTNRKQILVNFLRKIYLLQFFDYLRYLLDLKNNLASNKAFIKNNPEFRLPPPDLAYDAYGHTNWSSYYWTGKEHAQYISNLIRENVVKMDLISICEWGCGAARILRHIPLFFTNQPIDLYGFDYNIRTIEWCRNNIPDINFKYNLLSPPLSQESSTFDCLYCLSVFTHLSYEMHIQWMKELSRVVKPNGLIILTTHGDLTRANLLSHEIQEYDAGQLVVRGMVKEGKRTFVAYHPPSFIRNELLKGFTVVSHITNPIPQSLTQDIWVVRNSKSVK